MGPCKPFLKSHGVFIVAFALVMFTGVVPLMLFSKTDIHLFVNRLNSPFFDLFFKYVTEFGAFIVIAPVVVLLSFIRLRFALIALASSLLAVVITQVLKRLICYDAPRPKVVFEHLCKLHFVEDVQVHSWHSFPSGHTSGAFALFMVLGLISKCKRYQLVFLMMAVLVGYSRMYLSQHFLADVVVGAAVGSFSALVCYVWFMGDSNRLFGRHLSQNLDESIGSLWKKLRH